MCTGILRQITTASSGVWVNVRGIHMKLVQVKRKQQYIKAYCIMYPWYVWEEHCEFVYSVSYASPGRRPRPVKRKHGRHCLKWLREIGAISMSDLTSINRVIAGDMW